VDKGKLSDGAKHIQQAWTSGSEADVRRAIATLEQAIGEDSTHAAIPIYRVNELPPEGLKKPFLSTGLDWYDEILGGGLRQEELMIIGGVPHQGKTHFMVFTASCYLNQGATILHFNGEDLVGDVLEIYEKASTLDQRPENLYVADVQDQSFSIASIDATIGELAKTAPPDFVVVDYLDLITGSGHEADWLDVSYTTKALRGLAKKYQTTVITGTQLNYPPDAQGRQRSSFRRSAMTRLYRSRVGKSSHADVMLLLVENHDTYYQLELGKGKGRRIKHRYSAWECNFDTMQIEGQVERDV